MLLTIKQDSQILKDKLFNIVEAPLKNVEI